MRVFKLKSINTTMETCFKYPKLLARIFKTELLKITCKTVSFDVSEYFLNPQK